jgi:cellulose synthase/poly-beta-1,6-N-acetylglucosamine synthase-like glycosyltransferase
VNAATGLTWDVGVVIPARNEESSIERCIASVLAACDASSRCGQIWVALVADRCTDQTAVLGRERLGARGEVIQCAAGAPGSARRIGVAAVLRHFAGRCHRGLWLANTDADTYVPLAWIDTHLQHADDDVEAVAGIVQLAPEGLGEDVRELYNRTYQLAPDGTHAHVHGANFGVRADVYLDVGGWSDLTVSEDHCLWGRLRRRGGRLFSPTASVVHTSGRLRGRASGGFADTLCRELGAGE